MPILFQKMIYRADLRRNPNALYVFGDNLERAGYGGQAKEMRGEPNAVGIPTKRAPSMASGSFFSDADLDEVIEVLRPILNRLQQRIMHGDVVVWPADGIGTGLSELPQRAPTIQAYIDGWLDMATKHEVCVVPTPLSVEKTR